MTVTHRISSLVVLFSMIIFTASCRHDDGFDSKLIETMGGPCLVIKNQCVFRFVDDDCQESYLPARRLYRAGTDTMSDYFEVKMSEVPTREKQTVTCSLGWTDKDKESVMDRLSFKVQEIDDDLVWMWCSRQQITVAVRILH